MDAVRPVKSPPSWPSRTADTFHLVIVAVVVLVWWVIRETWHLVCIAALIIWAVVL